jgi:hypothetical protein
MEIVGIREMRRNLSRYTSRAKGGESFVITDRGQGSLLDALEELPQPIPGPPSETVLDELREERQ